METRPFIDTPERLATVVHRARTELGWTQAELSQRAGVGRRFIVDLEGGHPRAEIGLVMTVLKTLGLSPRAVPAIPLWAFHDDGTLKDEYRRFSEDSGGQHLHHQEHDDSNVSELTRALGASHR
ncbi:helix-turn-helix transcriptional regulator [Brevibacterium sp. 'Marine']|uniref:helix-turn-helix transcriptional regulator n=1 Tax=Brevibacterium sp. 'Marine' TaxID=2725563 RepID=UPI00145D0467|nr:helix-turn-helix transcriptional regulator [Brevibacterium sp. 'Marine']